MMSVTMSGVAAAEAARRKRWVDALGTLTDQHPVRLALEEMLGEGVARATEQVSRPELRDAERHWAAGYLAHVVEFREALEEMRKAEG